MREQKVSNLLWIVVPALMAIAMTNRGGRTEVVARGLTPPPVVLATDERPASSDGFFWEKHSTPRERVYRTQEGRSVRISAGEGEILLWCRRIGDAVYSLAGQGPDRLGPPCVIDPPFVLRRTSLNGGFTRTVCGDLTTASVFVTSSGAVCYADDRGVWRSASMGGPAKLICPRPTHNVTLWGAAGETLYWIEEAMPGGRDPVGSSRLMALSPGTAQPRTVAWAPDALTDLVVSGDKVAWYHPAGRSLEGLLPDGQVTVLARDINLATTPELVGDQLIYLCERNGGGRELATTSASRGGYERLARLDGSARMLGVADDGLYLSEEEGSWFSGRTRVGRLLRLPLPTQGGERVREYREDLDQARDQDRLPEGGFSKSARWEPNLPQRESAKIPSP
jgi:hypothetical protein